MPWLDFGKTFVPPLTHLGIHAQERKKQRGRERQLFSDENENLYLIRKVSERLHE